MFGFSIRSSTVRLGIFISALVITVILVFQLVWLNKIYRYEQKMFNQGVTAAIRGFYEDLEENAYYSSHLSELIENPTPNVFLVKITLPVNKDSVSAFLQYELESFNVFTNCHIGIYKGISSELIYSGVLPLGNTKQGKAIMPRFERPYDYIVLNFPNRKQYILSQINIWIISSGLLLLVLLLFGASLFYFYRQKFLQETQKDFIHNFTHEFKTPVSVMRLAADVLKNPSIAAKPEKLATYAGIVDYQSAYLQKQIEKLLQFSHTDSRQLHLNREQVNLHGLIREAIENLEPLIREKNVKLALDEHASDITLHADRDYLVIVITNLIDNAIKYSRNPEINIRTRSEGNTVILSVADNGIGIEKKFQGKIFKRFFRATKGDTYQAKGFGLGLSFVKKIIDAHKGHISVESTPGKGSIFTIELPVQ